MRFEVIFCSNTEVTNIIIYGLQQVLITCQVMFLTDMVAKIKISALYIYNMGNHEVKHDSPRSGRDSLSKKC